MDDWDARDRLSWCTALIVLSFTCVFVLGSQSAASFSTYALAILVFATYAQWRDVWSLDLIWISVALLGYLVLSSFWSEALSGRKVFSVSARAVLTLAFVVAVAETQLRGRTQRWLGYALSAAGLIAALGAFYLYVTEPPWDGRLVGLGQLDNNVIAGLIFAVAAIFSLRLAWTEHATGWRLFGAFTFVVLVAAVAFTGSRNAIMGLCCGVGVYIAARMANSPQTFFALVLPAALLAAVTLLILALSDHAALVFPRGDSFRFGIWQTAWQQVLEASLLFGKGILTPDDLLVNGKVFEHPHSMYISVLYQGGLIALGLFLLLIARTMTVLLTFFQNQDAKFALAILAISLPVYGFDEHELIDKVGSTWFLFWLPVAIALGVQWRPSYTIKTDEIG